MPQDSTYIGDFNVFESDFEQAQEFHQSRPEINQRRDESRRARVTESFERWRNDPNSFDFPGIDTLESSPKSQEKDKPFFRDTDDGVSDALRKMATEY